MSIVYGAPFPGDYDYPPPNNDFFKNLPPFFPVTISDSQQHSEECLKAYYVTTEEAVFYTIAKTIEEVASKFKDAIKIEFMGLARL